MQGTVAEADLSAKEDKYSMSAVFIFLSTLFVVFFLFFWVSVCHFIISLINNPAKDVFYELYRINKNDMSLKVTFVGGTDDNPVNPRDMLDAVINIVAPDIRNKIK